MDKSLNNFDNYQYYLKNNRLKVNIGKPGMLYRGSRFDWSGFITQVILDDTHTFCVPESLVVGQGTGGCGLCNEFGSIDPVGYNEAKPGEKFLKIGVGFLTKNDNTPYSIIGRYEIDPAHFTVEVKDHSAKFIVEHKECRGYGVRLEKIIELRDNKLVINYLLINTGSKEIYTKEYCHNFIGVDNKSFGEDYSLEFDYSISTDRKVEVPAIDNNKILWRGTPKEEYFFKMSGYTHKIGNKWRLLNTASNVGVSEEVNFPITMAAVWGKEHVVSPEIFIEIHLKPGESMSWKRSYEFFCIN